MKLITLSGTNKRDTWKFERTDKLITKNNKHLVNSLETYINLGRGIDLELLCKQ